VTRSQLYTLIAGALARSAPTPGNTPERRAATAQHFNDASALACELARLHPGFDRGRFLEACGVKAPQS
jgi:hypothetical protein